MKVVVKDMLSSLARLMHFVFWYAIAVAAVFYLLPIMGLFLEGRYDAMSSAVKFFSVIGFFIVVAAWQIVGHKERIKSSIQNRKLSSV
jgi:hypothetical protein